MVYADRDRDPDAKAFGHEPVLRVAEIGLDRLADNLARLGQSMSTALDRVQASYGDYDLESIELSAELTGTGEVRLIAASSVTAAGAIKLTFKKKDSDAAS